MLFKSLIHKIKRHYIKDYDIKQMRSRGAVIGDNCSFGDSYIDPGFLSLIEIGNNVTLSNATLLAHDGSTQHICKKSRVGKIKIGNNVFIGYQSIVLPNVRIGDNVVIGAGSVVTKDIPDFCLAVGVPARKYGRVDEKGNIIERFEIMTF